MLKNRMLSFSVIVSLGFLLVVSLGITAVIDALSNRLKGSLSGYYGCRFLYTEPGHYVTRSVRDLCCSV